MESSKKDFLPSFDQLPFTPGAPPKSDWGLWGKDDEKGTINLLTPERILLASKTIRKGSVFPLNWDLELPNPPLLGRDAIQHVIKPRRSYVNDDVLTFNTQSSTQWDGLTHFAHQEHGFYNGTKQEQITGKPGTRNGIQVWAQSGIVGRGVLIDYWLWANKNGIHYSPGDRHEISVSHIIATAESQGTKFQVGDILVLRTGWIQYYLSLSQEQRNELARTDISPTVVGLAQGEESERFLWDNHFAAVACDAMAFEAFPPHPEKGFMHDTILALWGMPIGEFFYLEKLAEDCRQDGVYEFFFTSAPLNKLGGVASPPNALAIK